LLEAVIPESASPDSCYTLAVMRWITWALAGIIVWLAATFAVAYGVFEWRDDSGSGAQTGGVVATSDPNTALCVAAMDGLSNTTGGAVYWRDQVAKYCP
jgi:hypothetical protein